MLDLSVCLIVKDEEKRLPGLLACLPLERLEVIVADTGSTDATAGILRKAGIPPFFFPWTGDFAEARNATLTKARRAWVLWLDADDAVNPDFWDQIEGLMAGGEDAYRFTVRSPRDDGSCESFKQIRLFRNHLGARFEGRVHEQLGSSLKRLGMPIADAPLEITHGGYADSRERSRKRERNLALLALEMRDHPRDPAVVMQYGNALCQDKRGEEARKAYLSLLPLEQPGEAVPPPQDECLRHFPSLIAESWEMDGQDALAADWHRLGRQWAPDYLRSGYWLARRAVQRGDLADAMRELRRVLENPPRIALVACDNEGVRRNALALAFLVAASMKPTGSALVSVRDEEAHSWLLEALDKGRPALEPQTVARYLADRGDWDVLENYLLGLQIGRHEDRLALEDGAEALLMANRDKSLGRILQSLSHDLSQSAILEAFAAMHLAILHPEQPELPFRRFVDALRHHPEDPTVVGQFCDFVNKSNWHAQAREELMALPGKGPLLEDILAQLNRRRG